MMLIKSLGICKKSMINVENPEKSYKGENTYLAHGVVIAIVHKLTSKHESYADIHDFNVPTLFEIGNISLSAYVTSLYNSFWWFDMVSLVDIATCDVINIDFMHPPAP